MTRLISVSYSLQETRKTYSEVTEMEDGLPKVSVDLDKTLVR